MKNNPYVPLFFFLYLLSYTNINELMNSYDGLLKKF